jgi:hypothetical protein
VIKNLPNEKSPGPDGFNNEFIKCCWPIIGNDIKELIKDFYDEKNSLESTNSSFITLIPKCDNPTTANDFRPISLLKCVEDYHKTPSQQIAENHSQACS